MRDGDETWSCGVAEPRQGCGAGETVYVRRGLPGLALKGASREDGLPSQVEVVEKHVANLLRIRYALRRFALVLR